MSNEKEAGSGPFVVGVDVGTGSVRAGVFSALDGNRSGLATRPIQMWRPQAEYAEQSSSNIWAAVGACVREAVQQAQIAPDLVVGIGFDATCSLVVLGQDDTPLTVSPSGKAEQNVVVWMDHRATKETDAINAGDWESLRFVGGKFSPEMEPPKITWLKNHLPETWAKTEKLLDLADFLTYKASGRDVRSLCTNVCKWGYLGYENRWDRPLYQANNIADILDNRRVSNAIRPLGEAIGPLTNEAAAHLGLTEACRVAVGIIDAHAGGLGLLGTVWELDKPADLAKLETVLALIGGTSSCHMAASKEAHFVPGVWGPYFGAMVPGMWLTEGGQSAAGSLIDAAITSGRHYTDLEKEAEETGRSVYELLHNRLQKLAGESSVADIAFLTRHLHVLDYHLGNRSPFADPQARGMTDGLPLNPTPEDDAVSYLATVQAVAYGTRAIIEALNASGFQINTLLATGGGTKNEVWLQTHADALQMPLVLGQESESVLLGAAILGANAGGAFASVTDAMQAMSRRGRTISPNPDTAAFHDAKYAVYRALYEAQKAHRALMQAV